MSGAGRRTEGVEKVGRARMVPQSHKGRRVPMNYCHRFLMNLRSGKFLAMILGLAAVLVSNVPARAQSFTMAQLMADGSTGVTIGGKQFFDFSYSSGTFGAGFANAPSATQVTVNFTSFTGTPTGVGMTEQLLGFLAGGGGGAQVGFSFKVRDLTTGITGADISLAGSTLGLTAMAHADETILGVIPGGFSGMMHTQLNGGGPAAASLTVAPKQSLITVTKGFLIFTRGADDFADISTVHEDFLETPTMVPEPASAVMLAFGALGLCGFRLRRKK